jgi:hypothetical protein
MNPFDQAWSLLKAPIYEAPSTFEEGDWPNYSDSLGQDDRFTMLPNLEEMGKPYMWESEDGNARGTIYPDDFRNSIKIDNFELNSDVKGQGKARKYLEDFIEEGQDYFIDNDGFLLDGVHVTNVEHGATGFWDKMVDAGVIDGAHSTGYIRTNIAGDEHYTHAYDDKTQPWRHELNHEYAEYHGLPTDAIYDQFVEKAYEYHGTVDLPSVLQHGIRGGSPKTRSKRYVPESLRAADLVNYTTTDPEAALRFAQERAKRTKQDPSKVGVVRMKTTDLPEYVEHQEPDYGDLQGGMSRVRQGSIPPEVLQQWS